MKRIQHILEGREYFGREFFSFLGGGGAKNNFLGSCLCYCAYRKMITAKMVFVRFFFEGGHKFGGGEPLPSRLPWLRTWFVRPVRLNDVVQPYLSPINVSVFFVAEMLYTPVVRFQRNSLVLHVRTIV